MFYIALSYTKALIDFPVVMWDLTAQLIALQPYTGDFSNEHLVAFIFYLLLVIKIVAKRKTMFSKAK